MERKEIKRERCISDDNIEEVAGGKTTSYNREYYGDGNLIGTGATFEQMLNAIDKLNKSGKLDYLKNK